MIKILKPEDKISLKHTYFILAKDSRDDFSMLFHFIITNKGLVRKKYNVCYSERMVGRHSLKFANTKEYIDYIKAHTREPDRFITYQFDSIKDLFKLKMTWELNK